jgi:hypothetical protein
MFHCRRCRRLLSNLVPLTGSKGVQSPSDNARGTSSASPSAAALPALGQVKGLADVSQTSSHDRWWITRCHGQSNPLSSAPSFHLLHFVTPTTKFPSPRPLYPLHPHQHPQM